MTEKLLEAIAETLHDIDEKLSRSSLQTKNVLTIEECACYLGVGRTMIYELLDLHEIPYVPIRGKDGRGVRRIRRCDADEYASKHLVRGPKDAAKLQDARQKPQLMREVI